MTNTSRSLDPSKLRRIALATQGLARGNPFGRGRAATLRAISHLGHIQIDTISVVARAHNHTLRTRVANFEPGHIDKLFQERSIFEYRFPVAAFRPMNDYRFILPHIRAMRAKPLSRDDRRAMKRVLDRVRAEGPLRSRDFEDPGPARKGWWDWKPAKRALERLYSRGDLMINARDGFQKSYDLTERVLPSSVVTREPTAEEFAEHLVGNTLRTHGVASLKSFAHEGRGTPLSGSIRTELERRTAEGTLRKFSMEDGSPWWGETEALDVQAPRAERTALLSPFDNLVIQRQRLRQLFDFDFLLECYVPEAKRRYGYFCLPILHRDRLIGRMDCKSHREQKRFEVKSLFLEPEVAGRRHFEGVVDAVARAIIEYASFDGCDDLVVSRTDPASARQPLRRAIGRMS